MPSAPTICALSVDINVSVPAGVISLGWLPSCYETFQNLLPAPVVTLEEHGVEGVFVVPDLTEFIPLIGSDFTDFFESVHFDWQRLAGARVLKIEGEDPYAYAERIAHTQSGNYLDHGVRVNSVFSSYRISGTDFSQRFGDIAGPVFPCVPRPRVAHDDGPSRERVPARDGQDPVPCELCRRGVHERSGLVSSLSR